MQRKWEAELSSGAAGEQAGAGDYERVTEEKPASDTRTAPPVLNT